MPSLDLFVVQVLVLGRYTVNKFVCKFKYHFNTGTLSSKNVLYILVYRNLMFVVAVPVENKQTSNLKKLFRYYYFCSIFYIKNESLDTSGVLKYLRVSVCLLGCSFKFPWTLIFISAVTSTSALATANFNTKKSF